MVFLEILEDFRSVTFRVNFYRSRIDEIDILVFFKQFQMYCYNNYNNYVKGATTPDFQLF